MSWNQSTGSTNLSSSRFLFTADLCRFTLGYKSHDSGHDVIDRSKIGLSGWQWVMSFPVVQVGHAQSGGHYASL